MPETEVVALVNVLLFFFSFIVHISTTTNLSFIFANENKESELDYVEV